MKIIYQDSQIVVINKPGGLLAVPGRGPHKQDCAASRLRHLLPDMIDQPAVHRLDMYTSGLMVFAVTSKPIVFSRDSLQNGRSSKNILAVVEGSIEAAGGEIRLPFRLDPDNRPLQIYDPVHGKMGITRWQKLATHATTTRLEFTPLTGRTHQLRVHAAHPRPMGLGAPIVGDSLYGSGKEGDKMLLHASFLQFIHPKTAETVAFHCPPSF